MPDRHHMHKAKGTTHVVAGRQGVKRPDDAPAGQRRGASLVPSLARPVRWSRNGNLCASRMIPLESPVPENRHAGFGERGEETCPRESACGPAAKAPDRPPTPYRLRAG